MVYKLGFSKHPNENTHFKFQSLYNTNTVFESKRIFDLDKVYLSFKEHDNDYHLASKDNHFFFEVGEKEDLIIRKLDIDENSRNYVQEKIKYVYIRYGQTNYFLVPHFFHKFNHHKILYVRVEQLVETSSLEYNLVWKCILHDDDRITFVHCQSGVTLGKDQPIPTPSTYNVDSEEQVDKIKNGQFGFKVSPVKHNETVYNTLIREADFYMETEENGATTIFHAFSDKSVDESELGSRPGEARYHTAPQIKDQNYIDEELFDLAGPSKTKFKNVPIEEKSSSSIFSIVKLGNNWKQEIELAHSISAIIRAHYFKYINPWNKKEKDVYNCEYFKHHLMYKENIKIFTFLHDYLTNLPTDQISPYFTSGKVVKLRSDILCEKHLVGSILLYLLMFYKCKIVSDRFLNDKDLKIEDEETLELKEQNDNRPDKETFNKLWGSLKALIFKNYRLLLEKQEIPLLFYEHIMKEYPGGEEFGSFHDFLNNVLGTIEHPYRTNDLNFKTRLLAHNLQIFMLSQKTTLKLLSGDNIKDPHQVLEILKTMSSPGGRAYLFTQDNAYCQIYQSFNNKKNYFIGRFFFRYKDKKIYVERLNTNPPELTPIEEYDNFPEKDKAYIVDYMSLMAVLAETTVLDWLQVAY